MPAAADNAFGPHARGALHRAAVVASIMALAACAAVAPREAAVSADPAVVAAPFEIQGRLSARRGAEGGAATFVWQHAGPADQVELSTPLGQTLARLAGDPEGVRAQWPDGRTMDARNWDELTERVLGVAIPVRGLAAWIRGLAHAGSPGTVERDPQGRPAVLRQDGWQIAYTYPQDSATRASRLTLRYEQGEPAEVRLVIDRWQ